MTEGKGHWATYWKFLPLLKSSLPNPGISILRKILKLYLLGISVSYAWYLMFVTLPLHLLGHLF